jgi:hypothetical protein
MTKNLCLFLPLLLLLFGRSAAGQEMAKVLGQQPAVLLGNELHAWQERHLQEKLYIQTDKEFYLAGEICWFKLYTVDALNHHPLDLSKVAYLEWLDKDNKPVLQAKAGLADGHGDGSVYLPLTLHSGNYKLRAYTSWMKNYGADWYFEKDITIANTRRPAAMPVAALPPHYSVAFFPEGGNLVENIACRVGFRITDQYGRGPECSGVVTEDDQDTVARFQPHRFGLGSFSLTPRPGHHYRAIFRLNDGEAVPSLLPAAASAGMVMKVTGEGDWLRVDVAAAGVADGMVYLIAHTRQSVKLAQAAPLKDGKAGFGIDKRVLGEGVSHLTLFNAARQPVCERLVFRQPAHPLPIALHADKPSYGLRQKIGLAVKTGAGADCSVSVYRVDALQQEPAGHIGAYLWLASDLRGKIESPGYYLDHPEDTLAMDNLMLTHGWRRFRWGDVFAHDTDALEFPPEYHGAILSGRIVDALTGAPEKKSVQVYLSVPGTRTQFTSAYSDDEGRVRLELKDFYGGQEIVVQTNPNKDSTYRVEITNPFSTDFTTDRPLPPFGLATADSASLADRDVDMQVLNRYVGERLKRFHLPAIDTSVFYYKADHSYLLDDYTRFTTMEEVMREYVTLMLVQRYRGHYHLPLFDLTYNQFFMVDPLILLDGVPVFNIDSLMILDPLKVRKLETVQRTYFMGGLWFDGIMNWTTYKGDLGGYILDPRATVVDYEGLALEREFYNPGYATAEAVASPMPDFRNVLYWSPTVHLNGAGGGALDFYTSDIPGQYIVVAEGLLPDGMAGTGITRFEVK